MSHHCSTCGCDLPQCANGCTYTWRERLTWWLSRTHLRWRLGQVTWALRPNKPRLKDGRKLTNRVINELRRRFEQS